MILRGSKHIIWIGDCLKILPTLRETVHLIVTSPPYFAQKDYGNDPDNFENAKSWNEYIEKLGESLFYMYKSLVDGGRCCIVIDDKYTSIKTHDENFNYGTHAHIITLAQKIGFLYKGLLIWRKMRNAHASGGARYLLGSFPYPPNIPVVTMFEFILIFAKKGKRKIPPEVKEKSKLSKMDFKLLSEGIWNVPPERKPYGKCPSPFPLEIPRRLIRLFSFVGDIVLDPFAGSGTTLLAAVLEGRIGWGIEINPEFAYEAHERVSSCLLGGD